MVTKGIYTWYSSGYMVAASEVPSAHSCGVDVFYHAAEHLSAEELQLFGANV